MCEKKESSLGHDNRNLLSPLDRGSRFPLLVHPKGFSLNLGASLITSALQKLHHSLAPLKPQFVPVLSRSDPAGAAVGSQGQGAAVGSQGQGAAVGSQGQGAAVGSQGQGAAVGSQGQGAAVGSQGQGAAVGSQGQGAAVGSQGQGAAVGSQGHGAMGAAREGGYWHGMGMASRFRLVDDTPTSSTASAAATTAATAAGAGNGLELSSPPGGAFLLTAVQSGGDKRRYQHLVQLAGTEVAATSAAAALPRTISLDAAGFTCSDKPMLSAFFNSSLAPSPSCACGCSSSNTSQGGGQCDAATSASTDPAATVLLGEDLAGLVVAGQSEGVSR
ncbi:unnamed protein product [Closterium sp. Naga37s-1]|nr:unnamed protein product [Closterium sp. Naga37s-1]